MPLVSVVMPVYNTELYLAEAIESILAQTFTDFELIIVDDASQDGSTEIMREYQRRDERVRTLRQARNMGVSHARNRGIDAARGQVIAFMDSDDVSLPTRLEKQFRYLQENPEVGAVGVRSKMVNYDLTSLISIRAGPCQHAPIALSLFSGATSLVGGSAMFRHQPLRAVGGFAAELRYGEEEDLFIRLLLQARIRYANLPETLYLQRQHDSNKSADSEPVAARQNDADIRRCVQPLWEDAPDDALKRFRRLRHRPKLNWSDRRAAKKDMNRLIEIMCERQLVEESERPMLIAYMNRQLEQASPRLWQMFCHWRRHRFGGASKGAKPC